MPPTISAGELQIALRLLKANSSIYAVSAYLKRREMTYSANSWTEIKGRIENAIKYQNFDRTDLINLLRETEEYGRQHVFLFDAVGRYHKQVIDESYLLKRLKTLDLDDLLNKPRIVDVPPGLQLVDIRLENGAKGKDLVVKGVGQRRSKVKIGSAPDGLSVQYDWQYDRGIYVLRISSTGLTELRVQSFKNALDYMQEAEEMFNKCAGFVERIRFQPRSLTKARLIMVRDQKKLRSRIRFGANDLRSKKGGGMTLSTGDWQRDLYDGDEEMEGTLEAFLAKGKGISRCDAVNCTWTKNGNAALSMDVHAYLGGASNEFQVIPHCERSDYEYVLEEILKFAK